MKTFIALTILISFFTCNETYSQFFDTCYDNIVPGIFSSQVDTKFEYNNKLYFKARISSNSGSSTIWITDGHSLPTRMIPDGSSTGITSVNSMIVWKNKIYFGGYNKNVSDTLLRGDLFVSDGTEAGTTPVKLIKPNGTSIINMTIVGDKLFFVADDGVNGFELWVTDGTTDGTKMVKDLSLPNSTSFPNNLTDVNGTLFFTLKTAATGTELYKSDGTEAGTTMIKDIYAGSSSSNPSKLINFKGALYFICDGNNGSGTELWSSTGTSAGTAMVKDINPGINSSIFSELKVANNLLFFSVSTTSGGISELWKSNGTSVGTVKMNLVPNSSISVDVKNISSGGDLLYFYGFYTKNIFNYESNLYQTDGTTTGTKVLVKKVEPNYITKIGSSIYFTDETSMIGVPWIFNGKNGTPLGGCVNSLSFIRAGDRVFTVAEEATNATKKTGYELYVIDECLTPNPPQTIKTYAVCKNEYVYIKASFKGTPSWYAQETDGVRLSTNKGLDSVLVGPITSDTVFYAQDSICGESSRVAVNVKLYTAIQAPVKKSATSAESICVGGSTTLSASGLGNLTWYEGNSGTTPIKSGTSFTTPNLFSSSIEYTVEAEYCGIKSERTSFIIEVRKPNTELTKSDINCFGQTSGSAELTVSNGYGTYQYTWSPNISTTSTATNLSKGTYTCFINDAKNCKDTVSFTIIEPTKLSVNQTTNTPVSCFGKADGTLGVTVDGGVKPYSYSWNSGETTAIIANKASGSYSCTILDKNNCQIPFQGNISSPTEVIPNFTTITDISCFGLSNGSVTASAQGGKSPYYFSWSSGETTKTISNKSAGIYTVIVKDQNNCSASKSIELSQPTELILNETQKTDPKCFGDANGSITCQTIGGAPPYNYSWSTGENTTSISNKNAGTYSCTVKDANQCSKNISITLVDPPMISTNISFSLGGTKLTSEESNATYQWIDCANDFPLTGETNRSYVTTKTEGSFKVRITKNGCTVTSPCVNLNQADLESNYSNSFLVYPNPTLGNIYFNCNNLSNISIYNALGQLVETTWSESGTQQTLNLNMLENGIYTIQLFDTITNETFRTNVILNK